MSQSDLNFSFVEEMKPDSKPARCEGWPSHIKMLGIGTVDRKGPSALIISAELKEINLFLSRGDATVTGGGEEWMKMLSRQDKGT